MKLIKVLTLIIYILSFNPIAIANPSYTQFTATAYCLRGKTASGIYVRNGIVAADPRLLKLGSNIDILGLGNFTVADTGGNIKGNRLDIWMPSCKKAIKFGRKKVLVKKII